MRPDCGLCSERDCRSIAGEFLTFGADTVLKQVTSPPRIALLGPVLNYEETRELVYGLQERIRASASSSCASSGRISRTGLMSSPCKRY